MKKDSEEVAVKDVVKKDIELLAQERKTDPAILAGAMEYKGWIRRKAVTAKEFSDAISEFLKASASAD